MRKSSLGQGVVLYAPMREQWREIGYRPNIGVRFRPMAGLKVETLQRDLTKVLEQSTEKLNEDAKLEIRRVNEELSKKIQLEDKGEYSLTKSTLDGQPILISRFDGKHKVPKGSLLTRTRGVQIIDTNGLYSVSFTFPLENAEEMERVWESFQKQLRVEEK